MSRDIIHLTPLPQWPPVPEVIYQIDPSDFSEGRDVLLLHPREEEPELAAEREAVEAEIHRQRDMVSSLLAQLEVANHEGELDMQIDTLTDMLRTIDASFAAARYGSAAELATLVAGLSQQASVVQRTTAAITGEATFQAGVLMAEITLGHIEHMSMREMADRFTAEHFAQMSDQQLDAVHSRVDRFVAEANQFGRDAAAAIEATGQESAAYRHNRDRLAKEKQEAKSQSDELRLQYLESINREAEFRRLGMNEQVGAEQTHRQEVIAAAQSAAREEAIRKARAEGKSRQEQEAAAEAASSQIVGEIIQQGQDFATARGVSETVSITDRRQAVQTYVEQEKDGVELAENNQTGRSKMANELDASNVFGGSSRFAPAVVAAGQQFAASGQSTGGAVPDEEQPETGQDVAPKTVAAKPPEKSAPSMGKA